MEKDKQRAKQLFAAMSRTEKLKHIGRYYWPHITAAVLAAVAVISIGITMHNSAVRSQWLHVGVVAPYTRMLQQPLEELGTANHEPLNYMDLMSVEGEYGADAMTQLSCYLAADQLDLAVCDKPMLEYLQAQDGAENVTVHSLDQTVLTDSFEGLEMPELYLVVRQGVTRSERAERFAQLLVTDNTP